MKKYYMCGTGEELKFGDMLQIKFYKELEDGNIAREMECKFTEGMVDCFLDLGIIEELDSEDDLIDFEDSDCNFTEIIQDILEEQAVLKERINALKKELDKLKKSRKDSKVGKA